MITRTLIGLRTALVAVAALGWWTGANAQMTPAGTSIQNRASVNYSVGGLPQDADRKLADGQHDTRRGRRRRARRSSSTTRVDLTVDGDVRQRDGRDAGHDEPVLAFTVANTGNAPQGYQLTVTEEVGTLLFGNTDNADFGLANLVSSRRRGPERPATARATTPTTAPRPRQRSTA